MPDNKLTAEEMLSSHNILGKLNQLGSVVLAGNVLQICVCEERSSAKVVLNEVRIINNKTQI